MTNLWEKGAADVIAFASEEAARWGKSEHAEAANMAKSWENIAMLLRRQVLERRQGERRKAAPFAAEFRRKGIDRRGKTGLALSVNAIVEAAMNARLPDDHQWVDAIEQFDSGKRRAAEAVRAYLEKLRSP